MPPSGATPEPPSRGRLALVVEDEALIAMGLELLLGRRGWREQVLLAALERAAGP